MVPKHVLPVVHVMSVRLHDKQKGSSRHKGMCPSPTQPEKTKKEVFLILHFSPLRCLFVAGFFLFSYRVVYFGYINKDLICNRFSRNKLIVINIFIDRVNKPVSYGFKLCVHHTVLRRNIKTLRLFTVKFPLISTVQPSNKTNN